MSMSVALIADDDEYFRMAISAILKAKLGFAETIETGSFDEAVERLEQAGRISIAIFDLAMPGVDGPATLAMIRESFDVEKLAVVSASTKRGDILQALEAGAHGFVSKGQGVGELQRALQQILDGVIYVPPALAEMEPGSPRMPQRPNLTPRRREVLELLAKGKSNKEIARELNIGPGTVKVHLAALFRRLGVANRAGAAVAGAELLRRLAPSAEPEAAPLGRDLGNDDYNRA